MRAPTYVYRQCCSAFEAHLEEMQRLEDMHHTPLPQLLLSRKRLLEQHSGTEHQWRFMAQ